MVDIVTSSHNVRLEKVAVVHRTSLSDVFRSIKKPIAKILPEKLLFQRGLRNELKDGEPELKILAVICDPSEICIDVGANHGVYSYIMAKYSRKVVAVEPYSPLVDYMKRVLPARVQVMNFAASDGDGQSEFYIPVMGEKEIDSRASLIETVNPGMPLRTITVRKQRLDELPFAHESIGVIKVDVEGNELHALIGAAAILECSKPTIIVESEHRHNLDAPENVFAFLSHFGYTGYFIHRSRLRPLSDFSVDKFQTESSAKPLFESRFPDYINNFVFVHPMRRDVLDKVRRIFPAYGN
jgi:FkbM family methyltransferase